jgi:hypothetical protein
VLRTALRSEAGRWTSIVLRSLHLAAAAWLAAALLGAPLASWPAGATMLASGLALFAADLAAGRIAVQELAGAWVVAKLGGVGWMLLDPERAPWLFFALLFGSSVFSHAPRELRHRPLWPTGARAAPRTPGSRPPRG